MTKLGEIEGHGWAELREDSEGKSVSMRVLPWSDYSLLTRAVQQLGELAWKYAYHEAMEELSPDIQELLEGEE